MAADKTIVFKNDFIEGVEYYLVNIFTDSILAVWHNNRRYRDGFRGSGEALNFFREKGFRPTELGFIRVSNSQAKDYAVPLHVVAMLCEKLDFQIPKDVFTKTRLDTRAWQARCFTHGRSQKIKPGEKMTEAAKELHAELSAWQHKKVVQEPLFKEPATASIDGKNFPIYIAAILKPDDNNLISCTALLNLLDHGFKPSLQDWCDHNYDVYNISYNRFLVTDSMPQRMDYFYTIENANLISMIFDSKTGIVVRNYLRTLDNKATTIPSNDEVKGLQKDFAEWAKQIDVRVTTLEGKVNEK